MGFFSKIWKGIKKTFKKIFKPIKKVFKSIGKFMGKIGVVGQIAMMFLPIPGLGALFGGLGKMGSKALGWLNKFGAVGQGAAKILGSGYKFVRAVAKPFVDITKGVKGFFEDITRYVGSKIPGVSNLFDPSKTPSSLFGKGGAWSKAQETITGAFDGFRGNISDAFSMNIDDLLPKSEINLTPKVKTLEEMYRGPEQELSVSTPGASNVIPDQQSFKLETGLDPKVTPEGLQMAKIDGDYVSLADPIEKPSFSMENYLENAATKTASSDVKTLEVFGDASKNQSLLSRVTEKAVDKFSSIPANLAQQYGGQKLGIYGEPMEDPGKPFGSQPFQQYYPGSSMAFDQARQEIFSQDSDVLGMRSMGLLQGDSGYGGTQQGFGFGGYDFTTIFENRFKQFAPAA